MSSSNWDQELVEMRIDQERDAGIARARQSLTAQGSAECVDCGEDIDQERRVALPSARRCVECQTKFERSNGR